MKLKKKTHFNLGVHETSARLYLRKTYTNLIITLTDLDDKVIICKTSGSSGITGSKRRKRVPQAIEAIIKTLSNFFKLYKIQLIEIVLKMNIKSYLYYLLKELVYFGIVINGFVVRREIAFNGVRGRKLRRL
jgi:ribosomal protein S11